MPADPPLLPRAGVSTRAGDSVERRSRPRHPLHDARGTLSWLDPESNRSVPAGLLNISGGGAAIVAASALPDNQPTWPALDREPQGVTSVECRLVGIFLDASGLTVSRLRFVEACPMDLFELAVYGSRYWGIAGAIAADRTQS